MKANELRIGNYILVSLKSGNGKASERQVGCQDIVRIYQGVGSFDYELIPLTEEWLLRFGFKVLHKTNNHYIIIDPNGYKDSHNISIFKSVGDIWHIAFSDTLAGYNDYIPTTKIEYVHQLQNLYFALTGEELTLK